MRGNAGARPGLVGAVAGERAGVLGDRAEADPVLVASGEERGASGRADGGDVEAVVGDAHLADAGEVRRGDGAAERVGRAVAGVVDQDEQHVRRAGGRGRAGDHRPVGDRVLHRAAGDTAKVLSGIGRRERSGVNLPAASASADFRSREAVHLGDRMRRGARQGPLGDESIVGVDEGDDHGGAGGKLLAEVLLEAGVDLLLGELPDDPTDGSADDDRAEHHRVEQADEHADTATPLEPLAAEVVGGVGDLDLTVGGVFHQDDAVGLDGLVGDGSGQLVEVLLRRLDRRVRGHQQFERITHRVVSLIREIGRTIVPSPVAGLLIPPG